MNTHSTQTPRRVLPCGQILGHPPQTVSPSTRSQSPPRAPALQVKTHVKASAISANHNETLVRATPRPRPRAWASAGRAQRR
jgi:hypothetical protein